MSRIDGRDIAIVAAIGFILLIGNCAQADIVTTFGGGYKLPQTSVVLKPECHAVRIDPVLSPKLVKDHPGRAIVSCGGDFPMFTGWPIAWKSDPLGARRGITVRAGWYHFSHWFDGGSDRETHLDCLCAEFEMNWSEWRRNRRR